MADTATEVAEETVTDLATTESDQDDHNGSDHDDDHGTEREGPEYPAAVLPRRRNVQVGTAFGTAGMLMYFAGLFGIYLAERSTHFANQRLITGSNDPADWDGWIPPTARLELTAPTIMAWTLLISVVTMQWAVYSFKRNDRRHGLMALGVQLMFGIAVINQHVFQWNQMGLVADDTASRAAPLIYAITISFVVALVAELIFLFIMAFRTLSGASTSQNVDGIASAAVVWYALTAVYFIIWILVFITK